MMDPAEDTASGIGYGDEDSKSQACSFCARSTMPAAVYVMLPVLGSKTRRAKIPYCLKCYYTTSAVRQDPQKYVSILSADEQARQLPEIQHMFSECFLELQQEISEESARAFQRQKKDPLAAMMLHHASNNKRKLKHITGKAPPDPDAKKAGKASDGGFLRDISIPERLLKMKEKQALLQQQHTIVRSQGTYGTATRSEEVGRNPISGGGNMFGMAATNKAKLLNQRRKGSRKSIWNLVMDHGPDGKAPIQAQSHMVSTQDDNDALSGDATCKCGSQNVRNFGNVTSRNQDMRKGEIWGTDRGNEVITRYQCNKCGRTWNEEE